MESFVFLFAGAVSIVLFHLDWYFPIWVSVTLMSLVIFYFVRQFMAKRVGVLMMILLLIYLLPFIHVPPYLWFDFSTEPLSMWGFTPNPYMFDKIVIELTAMLGATGALGVAFGVSLVGKRLVRDVGLNSDGSQRRLSGLSLPIFSLWIFIGVVMSWISAPQESVFTAEYTHSKSMHSEANFSSAWMISYAVLSFAFVDALTDWSSARRAAKRSFVFAAVAFVVIWLQILRGDRESFPWVFGLVVMYFYWAKNFTQRKKTTIPWTKLAFACFFILVSSIIIGAIRHDLVGSDLEAAATVIALFLTSDTFELSIFLRGTWTAVLLTPLSVAGDHIYNLLPVNLGRDFWDMFLSLPPGFLADAVGYERPLGQVTGPAWDMRYGIGGTHAVVLPFMNFRMVGVFLISALWSYFFLHYELAAVRRVSVINGSLLVIVVMAAPHWLWYGEKAGINAIIIWMILSFLYRVSLGLSRSVVAPQSLTNILHSDSS